MATIAIVLAGADSALELILAAAWLVQGGHKIFWRVDKGSPAEQVLTKFGFRDERNPNRETPTPDMILCGVSPDMSASQMSWTRYAKAGLKPRKSVIWYEPRCGASNTRAQREVDPDVMLVKDDEAALFIQVTRPNVQTIRIVGNTRFTNSTHQSNDVGELICRTVEEFLVPAS